MFTIIKNAGSPTKFNKYPFGQIEVGDAFDAPIALRSRLGAAAVTYGKRHGSKFSLRKVNADTVRVFRTA